MRNLLRYVSKWSGKGHCPEFTCGGLICSAGGWRAVKKAYRDAIRLAGDERLLGSNEFVETTLKGAGEVYDRRMRLPSAGIDISAVIAGVCRYYDIGEEVLFGPTKRKRIMRTRI